MKSARLLALAFIIFSSSNILSQELEDLAGHFSPETLSADSICGDGDDDGSISIGDLTYLRNYLFSNYPHPANGSTMNVNGCNGENIADIIYYTNWFFYEGPEGSSDCQSNNICPSVNSGEMSLNHVFGQKTYNTIYTGMEIRFYIRMTNNTGSEILGLTNGFRIYSPDGASWINTEIDTTGAITSGILGQQYLNSYSADGMVADTVGFGAFSILGTGIPDGFDDVILSISIGPFDVTNIGKTICIDTAYYAPSNTWIWSSTGYDDYAPNWDGPHCFGIGVAPDMDNDGIIDELDNCILEANNDQSDLDGDGDGDVCDLCPLIPFEDQDDIDGDGVGDDCDNCLSVSNPNQVDFDGDGIGNVCDNCMLIDNPDQNDIDGDDKGDSCDNCLEMSNSEQSDIDGDGIGDVCDNCVLVSNQDQIDSNEDGIGDACISSVITTDGINEQVSLANGLVELIFSEVVYEGVTNLIMTKSGPSESGFNILVKDVPQYFELVTTAIYEDSIEVCIDYSLLVSPSISESQLMLMHYTGGIWEEVTTSIDEVADKICGTVFSLSPFVVVIPITCCDLAGDFDGSGSVDIADLTATVNFMFNGGIAPDCENDADVNISCAVDIADMTARVNYMFKGGPGLVCGCVP